MKGSLPRATLQRLEEAFVRACDPAAVDRGRLVGRNLPVGFEAAEVIDANDVAGLDRPAHALDPPVVTARAQRVPVVQRIAPALSGLAEGVRRNAGDDFRRQIFLQAEEFGMGPDIGAVVADEDGDIADHANAAIGAIGTQELSTARKMRTAESVLRRAARCSSDRNCAIVSGSRRAMLRRPGDSRPARRSVRARR